MVYFEYGVGTLILSTSVEIVVIRNLREGEEFNY